MLALLGPAVAVYLLAWLLLPDRQGGIRLERALRHGDSTSVVLLVAALVVFLPDAGVPSRIGVALPRPRRRRSLGGLPGDPRPRAPYEPGSGRS